MRYLIDSDWVIDGIAQARSARGVLDELMAEGVAVSIVTLGEVFEGAFSAPDPQAELLILRRFLLAFAVIPLAATAVRLDLTLVTRNLRHFTRIPDLKIYDANKSTLGSKGSPSDD